MIETLTDPILRAGIRAACTRRLERERRNPRPGWVAEMRRSPIAVETAAANEQHYEVEPELFRLVLGPRLKYSCCYWPDGVETLAAAEEAMLSLTCERAGIEDGMEILDLGCGWGSLTGWLSERYPSARILAVSNSHAQRATIEAQRLPNVDVVTAGRERLRSRPAFRPRRLGRDDGAHPQLGGTATADRVVARTGRQDVRPRLLPPDALVPLRETAGWRGTSSPAG